MIKNVLVKNWVTVIGCHKGKSRLCEVATRICDRCGVQEEARLRTLLNNRRDRHEDKDYCYKCAQSMRVKPTGPNYAKWKHGKTCNGYSRVTINKKRILEHVHVMQEHLGRQLIAGETVHHIDMNKLNNTLNNLYLFNSQAEHQKCHISMEKCGFSLLGEKIWFDWEKKEYCLTIKNEPHFEKIELPELKLNKRQSYGQEYWFYKNVNKSRGMHLLIMELVLKRTLYIDECVHHINGNGLDNSLTNLCVLKRKEHAKSHFSLQKCVAELYQKKLIQFSSGIYTVA